MGYKNLKAFLFFFLVVLTQLSYGDIFGRDDRINPKPGSVQAKLARSVAVGVLVDLLEKNDANLLDLNIDNMSDFMCKDEKFSKDSSLAYACTGFLVAPDLLMTAGHCSSNYDEIFNSSKGYCESYSWMFDYIKTDQSSAKVKDISPTKVYKCREIVYAVADEKEPFRDFALIRLDRPVLDRKPLKLSIKEVRPGQRVSMLGFPMGMPVKYTGGGRVIENKLKKNSFLTSLDAFSGNSGSPVFNGRNEVVGILISGSPADGTYKDKVNKCERYNRCDKNGKNCKSDPKSNLGFKENGSDVEKITKYKEFLDEYSLDFMLRYFSI